MNRGFTKGRGWGYAIDYDAAIAEDDRVIALYDGPVMRAMSAALTDEEQRWISEGYQVDVVHFVLREPETRGALFGLTGDDVTDLAFLACADDYEPSDAARKLAALATAGAYSRALALAARFPEPACLESVRADIVRRAKASRARHVRNAAKRAAS